MKMYKYIAVTGVLAFMTSCGVADRNEEISKLEDDREEWTADQTNEAIDIYLEGLSEAADLSKDVYLLRQKHLNYEINSKGKKSVVKERKDEMKEAVKEAEEVEREYKKKMKELYED